MAAAHAAGGAAGALAPRLDDAMKAAYEGIDALLDVARDGARQANTVARRGKTKLTKKDTRTARRRWPMMMGGLLVAGAAVGAAGALISRRRSRQKWTEYSTSHSASTIKNDARSMIDNAKSAIDDAVDSAQKPRTESTTTRPTDKTNTLGQYSGQTAGTGSKNSRP
jgi:hypothetical protein